MILNRCTLCHSTQKEPLTWAVAAWNRADGARVAYKHRLCITCTAAKIVPLYIACESDAMKCPNCGIDVAEDYDAVWVSFVPKGVGLMKADAPFCGACAAHFRIWFQDNARLLEQDDSQVRGREDAPHPTAEQVLAGLGLLDHGPR